MAFSVKNLGEKLDLEGAFLPETVAQFEERYFANPHRAFSGNLFTT